VPYYEFGQNEVIYNTIKTFPRQNFIIYQGAIYYKNRPEVIGDRSGKNVGSVPVGYVNLHELNVDRPDSELIYPFVTKDGTLTAFKTISTTEFNGDFQYGDVLTGSYPMSASISRDYFEENHSRPRVDALKNTLNFYRYKSKHYNFNSDLGNKATQDINLISIPSIFYGSQIKKKSLELNFYITGTLVGTLQDINGNGELIQTGPAGSNGSGSVAGVALYTEGVLVLTGNWAIGEPNTQAYTGGSALSAKWIYFGVGAETSSLGYNLPNSSHEIKFSGSSQLEMITMLATAPAGELNHSNNPTYISASQDVTSSSSGSRGYSQNDKLHIKNVTSGNYSTLTSSFQKETYISEIGIYDENKNLIGIAKLATPIRKTEERDLTFKLKFDI
tara:strand:+ start:21 stop:1184 length:1164 start_codon:yes stop_codon:yes gene_type:complete